MSLIIWLQCVELILYLCCLKNTNYISYIFKKNAYKNISFTYCSSFFIFKSVSHPLYLLGLSKARVQDSTFLSCFYSKLDSQKFFIWDHVGVLLVNYQFQEAFGRIFPLHLTRKKPQIAGPYLSHKHSHVPYKNCGKSLCQSHLE